MCVPRLMDVRAADGHRADRQQAPRRLRCRGRRSRAARRRRARARSERRADIFMAAIRGPRRASCARWGGSLPHGRRGRSSGARGTDSNPRDGTPRRRSRAAHRQRPAARLVAAHSIACVDRETADGLDRAASPRERPRRSRRAGSARESCSRSSKPMWCTMTSTPRLFHPSGALDPVGRAEIVSHHLDTELAAQPRRRVGASPRAPGP